MSPWEISTPDQIQSEIVAPAIVAPAIASASETQTQFQNYYDTLSVKSIRSVGKEFNDLRLDETASISPQL